MNMRIYYGLLLALFLCMAQPGQGQTFKTVVDNAIAFIRTASIPKGFSKKKVEIDFAFTSLGVLGSKQIGTLTLDSALVRSGINNVLTKRYFLKASGSCDAAKDAFSSNFYKVATPTAAISPEAMTISLFFSATSATPQSTHALPNTLTVLQVPNSNTLFREYIIYGVVDPADPKKKTITLRIRQYFTT